MPVCEMCGRGVGRLRKTKIEGAILDVCDGCARTGEAVDAPGMRGISRGREKRARIRETPQEEIVEGFGKIIIDARSAREWDTKKLAEELHEKETLMHKIEAGKIKPDIGLAHKIERKLSVKLVAVAENGEVEEKRPVNGGMTIGDFIKVKKRK